MGDPHIHVEARLGGEAVARNMLAATFGLVGDAPREVETGCGLRVPYAMTSTRPGSVTCLPCREHARREHERAAEQVVRLAAMPGSVVTPAQAAEAATAHRELARQFE
ncbi:hypothetical protein [Symbioplanes lichenis]|uniref:hypothetical protein n=1 Tax=Symbioplanes lichenis TaxID=1629072 RepID=UPI002738204D|nr:hypothetical protein [Actinoplanes lichenis]